MGYDEFHRFIFKSLKNKTKRLWNCKKIYQGLNKLCDFWMRN
jgi:hypothetical protein